MADARARGGGRHPAADPAAGNLVDKAKPDSYRIAEADLRLAATRGASIATTLDGIQDDDVDERQLQVLRDNLANMRRAGNTIVIGTDSSAKPRAEARTSRTRATS